MLPLENLSFLMAPPLRLFHGSVNDSKQEIVHSLCGHSFLNHLVSELHDRVDQQAVVKVIDLDQANIL